ncbi:MAG: hypothetical protein JJ916_04900 [Phycisphaerales bacterium]|nr:hypothetical protein [Phycisphaerales bacterium]
MKYAAAIAAVTIASGSALAGFDADWNGFYGYHDAIRVDTTGSGGVINEAFNAGHFHFVYTDVGGDRGLGQFSGGSFSTFCIELQNIANGSTTYEIDSIQNAPNPSGGAGQGPYDNADANEVNAVMAAAVALGWINWDLSDNGMTKSQAAAVQGMVWKVVFDNAVVTAERSDVAADMAILQAQIDANPNASIDNLRAMLSADSQDQLFIVPLPTAAFAGLMTLAGIGGIKRLRRS